MVPRFACRFARAGQAFVSWLFLSLMLVVAGSSHLLAQETRGIPAEGPPAMTPAQVQQLFDAMLVMQAQEALSLNEQQYAQFLTRVRVLQETRRRHLQQRNRLINELQRLTNPRNPPPNVTETEVKQRLDALQELEARTAAELRKAYSAIDEVLDVRQQARFRVFEEQIERRKLELVARARQQNQNRAVPPRRQPPR
jgi:hypothetical protein